MGLPSGTLWSPVNVDDSQPDGFARSPFQYGASYFSWGNTEPRQLVSENSFDYNWGRVNAESPWYEGQPYGSTQGASVQADLSLSQDGARHVCGGSWRMPTSEEFSELFANCDFIDSDGNVIPSGTVNKRTSMPAADGMGFVSGIRLQSKINGRRLFLASLGHGEGTSLMNRGTRDMYWSSSIVDEKSATSLTVFGTGINPSAALDRYVGCPIRPVMRPSE